MTQAATLPQPQLRRWQPLRCGLVNLFKYDDQAFRFERGRLLLRGNNGTGKSRVLALTLPFLLDANTDSSRLEPDQDRNKRIEWNLLMGRHDERVGYTWIEFGRLDDDGAAHYFTLGCGLKAVKHRTGASHWFFTTRQRVGDNLQLVAPLLTSSRVRIPLTRERLSAALGDAGRIYDTAREYRIEIDRTLFELGETRYEALMKLLIQLRRPQLSRTLDETELSRALSEAMNPLREDVILHVADAMASLEKDQQQLEDFQAARRSADEFLGVYRQYARVAARRAAAPVRKTHSAYEQARRDFLSAQQQAQEAQQKLEAARQQIDRLRDEYARVNERVQVLAQSPEMKSAQELERSRQAAQDSRQQVEQRQQDADAAARRQVRHEERLSKVRQQADAGRRSAEGYLISTAERADHATLGTQHRTATGTWSLDQPPDDDSLDIAGTAIDRHITGRFKAVDHMENLDKALAAREQELAATEERWNDQARRKDEAATARRRAGEAIEEARDEMVAHYRAWQESLQELAPQAALDDLAEQMEQWIQKPQVASPLVQTADAAWQVAQRRVAAARAACQTRRTELQTQRQQVQTQIAELEDGRHTPPPVPHTRDPQATVERQTRPGAPLWQLVTFQPDVAESDQAGLEAALEACGLLDAWVMPDGRVLDAAMDTFAFNASDTAQAGVTTLAAALQPEQELPGGVTADTVRGVLIRVGLGEQACPAWVTIDGRWQAGAIRGRWHKPHVQHIGQTAREAQRQRRLTELRAALAELGQALEAVASELHTIDRAEATADAERKAGPRDDQVRHALASLDAAQRQLTEALERLAEIGQQRARQREARDKARSQRDQDAQDLGLEAWVDRLHELRHRLHAYQQALTMLRAELRRHRDFLRQVHDAADEVQEAQREQRRSADRLREARTVAGALNERYRVLQETVGVSAQRVIHQLGEAKRGLVEVENQQKTAEHLRELASAEQSRTEARKQVADVQHQSRQQERDDWIVQLQQFVQHGLLATADAAMGREFADDAAWSPTRGVEIARHVETAFSQADSSDEAWQRASTAVLTGLEQLKENLGPRGYPPQNAPTVDQLYVVTVPYQNRTCSVSELCQVLGQEIVDRQNMLDAKEKQVIENHLIDEVASHLHELIQQGEVMVAAMNRELAGRTTSTGMELKFAWTLLPDADKALEAARKQLLQSPDVQTPQQRQAMADFLQQQIRTTRQQNDMLTWRQCLEQALDYRRWHRFGVERRVGPAEPWQRLTRQLHGTGSGGEKAIALTIPQFAAASAHYHSASELAPRLIMLDEAFVGVDPDMRSQCMELLQQFDLDFVMTSESEWGCYAGLDGNAIYQLATAQGMDAVLCTRWVWNGVQRRRDDHSDRVHDVADVVPQEQDSIFSSGS